MNKELNIGILGYGWVARDYMYPAIAKNKRVRLTAVCAQQLSEMQDLPEKITKYTDISAFLKDSNLDAVYIATPNHLHKTHTLAALDAGLHVLCEKPLATSIEDAEIMINGALESDRIYATAYDQRFHPGHLQLKSLIENKEIGAITQVKIDYACWLPKEWSADNWRIDVKKAGGGAIIDLAPHGLDLLETLLQDKIVELQAFSQRQVQQYTVDDGGVLLLRFASGILGSIHVGYNRPDVLPRRTLEVFGTHGMLRAFNTMGQDPGGTLSMINLEKEDPEPVNFDVKQSPFETQLEDFISSILDEKKPSRTPQDDLRLFKLLINALEKENQWH